MKNVSILVALLGGAVAGAAVALLFAPQKGEDLRGDIARYLKDKGICLKKDKMDALVDEIAQELQSK